MSLDTELFAYLAADAGVALAIGDRLYPRRLPQNPTLPAAVYFLVDEPRMAYTHDNAGSPGTGTVLTKPRYQIDCWAETYLGTGEVSEAIIRALSGFHGTMGSVRVDAGMIANTLDDFETNTGYSRRIVDAILTTEEVIA